MTRQPSSYNPKHTHILAWELLFQLQNHYEHLKQLFTFF